MIYTWLYLNAYVLDLLNQFDIRVDKSFEIKSHHHSVIKTNFLNELWNFYDTAKDFIFYAFYIMLMKIIFYNNYLILHETFQ